MSRPSRTNRDDDTCATILIIIGAFACYFVIGDIMTASTTISTSKFPGLEIDSVKVSNFNLSNPVSAHWNINMNVNLYSNDISFNFYDNVISIFHESKGIALWMTSFQRFGMSKNNPKVHFTVDLWGSSTDVDNSSGKAIGQKIANNHGVVKFVVEFKSHKPVIWFKSVLKRMWYNRNIDMLVSSCEVELLFGSPDRTLANMLMNDSKACRVYVVRS